jgi:precorrin-3B synthase
VPATPSPTVAPSTGAGLPRTRRDRCPAVQRPWAADDGHLVRLRLAGGHLPVAALRALLGVAETHGDGRVHVTGRANLQVRALPGEGDRLPPAVEQDLLATGLVPSPSHELARNLLASPQTGLAGGRADLRPLVAALDAGLCASPRLAALPGRFLFVLDDGRGDLVGRSSDLGLVALDADAVQLRLGDAWGPVLRRTEAVAALLDLARTFLDARGEGPGAAWHVTELATPLLPAEEPDPHLPEPAPPLPHGPVPGGHHAPVPETGLDRSSVDDLVGTVSHVVVTPWRGLLVPGGAR